MELLIFSVLIFAGLASFFYLQNRKKQALSGNNYYYNRFMRNKLQTKRNINELEQIILLFPAAEKLFVNDEKKSLQLYIVQLQNEFDADFPDIVMKKLRRNNLKFEDKKKFAKLLVKQSERLYHMEVGIANFNKKQNDLNYISV